MNKNNSINIKRLITASITILAVIVVVLSGVGFYILHTALSPAKWAKDIDATYKRMFEDYPFLEGWVSSLNERGAINEMEVTAHDGTILHAIYIKADRPTKNTAVVIHGHKNNAVNMLHIAYLYHNDMGFNVLLPDLRGHGKSGGDHIQMGWNDRLDVMQWMDTANELFGDDTQMVIHGISMGAATAMMVSGEEQPHYVKAYVEDCGYTSVWDEFFYVAKKDYHLPQMPFLYIADRFCKWRYGWGFKEASAVDQVRKADKPMLFIHGDADTYVPTEMVYTLFDAKVSDKELWVVPGVAHALSYHDYPEEYTNRVKEFVNTYLNVVN